MADHNDGFHDDPRDWEAVWGCALPGIRLHRAFINRRAGTVSGGREYFEWSDEPKTPGSRQAIDAPWRLLSAVGYAPTQEGAVAELHRILDHYHPADD